MSNCSMCDLKKMRERFLAKQKAASSPKTNISEHKAPAEERVIKEKEPEVKKTSGKKSSKKAPIEEEEK